MKRYPIHALTTLFATCGCVGIAAGAESHLMRMADVHEDQVVFTYEGDLWLGSTAGGDARRITSDPGSEVYAKFSPDGSKLAFSAQYDGGYDVYVMDARGGMPARLTYHPAGDRVLGWFPDGTHILFRSNRVWPFRGEEIYSISINGGMPERLPVDRAGLTTLSPDGKMIAYNRQSRETRTWKRHTGGTAQNIWMGSLKKKDYRKITDWKGTDNYPMWQGNAIYFVSDRRHGTLNLYHYNTKTGEVRPLTHYKDYDVKYPSIGPGAVIYQYGEVLHLLDLKSGKARALDIRIPSDLSLMRPKYVDVGKNHGSFRLSPTGKRMLLETRGEIINVPVEKGSPVNLTRSSASREKNAAWSPDGRWIAFISDRTGEEELYLIDQKGANEWKPLTTGGLGFRMQPVWSPDSKYLLYHDKFMRLNLVDAETGGITVIDQGEYDDAWERWGIQDYVWSPCSRWVAYSKQEQSLNESIFLYSLDTGEITRVTDYMTTDWSPSFSPDGKYLYFLSNRTFEPIMGFVDQNHIFLDMCRPYLVLLSEEEANPFAPEDTTEEIKEQEDAADDEPAEAEEGEEKADADEAEPEKKAEEPEPTRIDLGDFERRTLVVDGVEAGNYFRLEAIDGGFLYLAKTEPEFSKYQTVTDHTSGKLNLHKYDLKEKKADKLMEGITNYHLSADGKKMVYRAGSKYGVVDAGSKASVGDGNVSLADVRIKIDRQEEFMQMFDEAWRLERDWFYDPNMHGVDWEAIGEKYRRFVPHCGNRSDLNYLIGEMIAELNAGHTYVGGGDYEERGERIPTGLLGVDFDTPPGAAYHRIAHIVPGNNWDESERSPLYRPDCPIKEGDYLIAIDGEEIRSKDNVYRALENKADMVVALTYNSEPSPEGAETYHAKTLGSEYSIRYREWVDHNAAKVAEATDGRVGYVHIPNMGENGLREFARVFYPQHFKEGLVIDVRYNGGGFTGDMIIDRLERKLWSFTQPREGKVIRDPERNFHGHFVVVLNEDTGSNGEYFAEAIKRKGLATLIGMRTWGGAVGIEPHQDLVDGGVVTPPQFAPFGLNGQWLIEGHGVDPDIEVQNMPGDVLRGMDAQLDAAIEYLVEKIQTEPVPTPGRPVYPDKSKEAA